MNINADVDNKKLNLLRFLLRILIWLLGIIILGFILGVVTLYILYGPHRNFYRLTDSLEAVSIQISEHHFAIPKAYIWDKTDWKGGIRNGVNMHALLPDLHPYMEKNAEEFKKGGLDKKILILLKRKAEIFSSARTLRIYREKYIDDPPVPGPAGLMRYQFTRTFLSDELFVNEDNQELPVVIMCKKVDAVLFPSCNISFIYLEDLMIKIVFSRKQLPNWKAIKEKVISLMDSFQTTNPANSPEGEP